MNKSILTGIILCLSTLNLGAQDQVSKVSDKKSIPTPKPIQKEQPDKEPTELLAGLILAPFAVTTFEDNPPFSTGISLFFATAIVKGDWSFAPYYSFGSNGAGAFVTYNISGEIGTYVAVDKTLGSNTGNYSLGFTTPMAADFIQGYIEIGSTYGDDPTPFLGVGVYFNLFKSIKSW